MATWDQTMCGLGVEGWLELQKNRRWKTEQKGKLIAEKKKLTDWGKVNWMEEQIKRRAEQSTARQHLFVSQLAVEPAILQ